MIDSGSFVGPDRDSTGQGMAIQIASSSVPHSIRISRSSLSKTLWLGALGVATLVGAWLRLDQFLSQVLIDDEWHAVHQVLHHTPTEMFFDFGRADYSIPVGILAWFETHWWGLSEIALRWPMQVCGLLTLIAFPVYVAPRVGRTTAAVFALLLAISPLLVIYSRQARPYAITLLLCWIAHGAFQRYWAARRGRTLAGCTYAAAASLAVWLHPVIAPFAVAPLLWGIATLRSTEASERLARFRSLVVLAIPMAALVAALVLPPLIAHPESLAARIGVERPDLATMLGIWYEWLGTSSTIVTLVCVALAAFGAPVVWRALPEARTGTIGIALTWLMVEISRPAWSQLPLVLARYLLPFLPLLLLCVSAGSVRFANLITTAARTPRRVLWAAIATSPCIALALLSPLAPLLRYPNNQTLQLVNYIDFRPEKNPLLQRVQGIPLSPFWASLAAQPPGTLRIAAAPLYFESYNWDAPRWERLSGQSVLPGYLTGLCVRRRWGELPRDPTYRFRNAVHLADDGALAAKAIDYIVWQKPYVQTSAGSNEAIGLDTAQCEAKLREKFGRPEYEDAKIIAFHVSPPH
jgi:Dolichyl-phosphate-mannose-protein mannosyltransferase